MSLRSTPRLPLAIALLAATVAPFAPAAGEELRVTFDPEATEVTFFLEATGHDVEGRLFLQRGEFRIDPATGLAEGEVAIDARRAETGNARRDKTMHRKVLESDEHPLFLFRAERLEGEVPAAGRGELELHGTLRIHGEEHPLSLPTTVSVDGDRLSATTTFPVPYVEWGMHDPSMFVLRVAKVVQVEIAATATLSPSATHRAAVRP